MIEITDNLLTRFWSKVDKNGPVMPYMNTPCWVWQGQRDRKGYGRFYFGSTGRVAAHRLAYELENGPVLNELFACHHCDNPPCVNPDHIFPGTNLDNSMDAIKKGRRNPLKLPPTKVLVELRRSGLTLQAIASRYNAHHDSVRQALVKAGCHIYSRLTIAQTQSIRTRWASGTQDKELVEKLAIEFNRSTKQIEYIIKRKQALDHRLAKHQPVKGHKSNPIESGLIPPLTNLVSIRRDVRESAPRRN